MENKNSNTILIILLITFILSTISLGGYIIYDKSINKQDTNNNEITNNGNTDDNINDETINININDLAPLTNTLNENWLLSFMKFDSPENLLKEKTQDNYMYLKLELQSSEYADFKLSDMEQTYGITNDNMKKFFKERFNYNYPDNEIKKYFKNSYNTVKDFYLFTISGGIIPPQIESIQYQDEKYYINIYLESDHIKKGTVILKQENNQFYFYSSTGLN